MIKVAIFELDAPYGKRDVSDERLDKLKDLLRCPKVTCLKIEFQDSSHLKDADMVLCSDKAKLDLILMDLETVEQRIAQGVEDAGLWLKVKQSLEKERFIFEGELSPQDKKKLAGCNLITHKPVICINQQEIDNLDQIIKKLYLNSGRLTFFTANQRELRAWSVNKGTSAYQAAGMIHSDIQRGFIKAEVVSFQDLIKSGGLTQAKAAGYLKLENKDYLINDADFIHFRFNV